MCFFCFCSLCSQTTTTPTTLNALYNTFKNDWFASFKSMNREEIEVEDDRVVSNIASNDIKGHWRSDSVELCVDPVGGTEHTMGAFKLGIFPFDATGVVRAAAGRAGEL